MLRSYRIVSVNKAFTPTAEKIASARTITAIDEILNASEGIAKFEFVKDDELTKALRTAESIEMTIETLDSGARVNRLKAYLPDRKNPVLLRAYGKGRDNVAPAKTFTKDEIGKLVFGFCYSGGEQVTTPQTDFSGEVVNVPVLYANLA